MSTDNEAESVAVQLAMLADHFAAAGDHEAVRRLQLLAADGARARPVNDLVDDIDAQRSPRPGCCASSYPQPSKGTLCHLRKCSCTTPRRRRWSLSQGQSN